MKLAVIAKDAVADEFRRKPLNNDVHLTMLNEIDAIDGDADMIIDLMFTNERERIAALKKFLPKPVLINAVIDTIEQIQSPFIRINAWPGFVSSEKIEVAAGKEQQGELDTVFASLGWKYLLVPDITGMVSGRVISMMINEAYFALEEQVSTKQEIDIAMKLGTNYPYGPFEWAEKIGIQELYRLLIQMQAANSDYEVAALLKKEAITAFAV